MNGNTSALVRVGWLWFDDDTKSSLEDKIGRAAARYFARFGRQPRICYVHRGTLGDQPVTYGRLQVRSGGYVLPNHFLFVVDGEPADPSAAGERP